MNSKILLFALTAILASLLLVSTASALSVDSISDLSLSRNTTSIVLHEDSKNLTVTSPSSATISDGANNIQLSLSPVSLQLNSSGAKTIIASIFSMPSTVKFGRWTTTLPLNVTNNDNTSDSSIKNVTLSFVKGFCKAGDVGGNLSIDSVDISSSGEEDLEWMPLDEVTVEVKVEDTELDDESTREVVVELGLFNKKGKNVIGDMEFSDSDEEKIEVGTIKDGDSSKVTFTFKVPADFNFDDGSDYKLAVKAYSYRQGESKECVDTADDLEDGSHSYQSVTIDRQTDEDKFIAFDQISLSQEEVTCGDIVTLDVTAYNVGDSDQDDLIVYLDNKALKVAQQKEFKNGVEMDDSVLVSFEFVVPQGLKDGFYNLELSADYDDGNSDEPTPVTLKVLGCNTAPVVNQTTTETTEEPAEKTSAWESVKGAFSGNGLIWLVAAINIILILVIIVVAVRIARR